MEHVVWVVTPTVTNQLQRFSKRSHTKCLTSGFSAIGAALLAHWLFDSYGPTSPTPLTMYKPGATNDPQNPLSHFLPCVSHLLLGKKSCNPRNVPAPSFPPPRWRSSELPVGSMEGMVRLPAGHGRMGRIECLNVVKHH